MRTIGQCYTKKFRNISTGQQEEKFCEEVLQRLTRDEYGHNSTYRRKLIVTLHAPDTITIKPIGFRAQALVVTANIGEVYKTLLTRKLTMVALEKAREKKAAKKEVRERRNRAAKERRFRNSLKTVKG